jgi:hypothetical protein
MQEFFKRVLALGCVAFLLSGCATDYQKSGFTGGYSELQLKDDIWRVRYGGNGYTTYETVQTYWLIHCAQMALDKGYSGFEILSDLRLSMDVPVEALESASPMRKAHSTYVPIYVPGGGGPAHPQIIADIRLLHGEIQDALPKQYNAAALKQRLEPIVNGKKCDNGNVCPHVHDYVYGTTPSQS